MSNTNEAFIKSFHDCIFQLRNHSDQCKEAIDLLKTHMKYHDLDETMLYEYMISAFYANENVDDVIVKVLNSPNCRINDCLSNYKFYNTTLTAVKKIEYTTKEGNYYSSTPSIMLCPEFMKKDFPNAKYIVNQRFVNYKIVDGNKYYYEVEPKHPLTFNKRLMLDTDFNLIDSVKLKGNLEDVRLFEHDKKIHFSSSFLGHRDGQWGVSICVGEYPTEKSEQKELEIDFSLLTTTKKENVEKNWTYLTYDSGNSDESGQLYLVYQWYPLVIGKINKESSNTIKIAGNEYGKEEDRICYNLDFTDSVETPFFFKNARGSTNSFKYNNNGELENWFIVHIVSYEVPRHYYNVIAIFDNEMNLIKYSYPFKFSKEPIEYALGLIINKDEVIISYSTWDNTSNVAVYDKEYIDSLIRYE